LIGGQILAAKKKYLVGQGFLKHFALQDLGAQNSGLNLAFTCSWMADVATTA
jgi:hypothetical protein